MGYSPPNHDSARSVRLYRLLLLAYPRTFREEYAAEMLLVFRDAYRDTLRRQGTLGVLLLWRDFFYDFIKTVCIEHGRCWMQWGRRAFVLAGKDSSALMLQFTLNVAQHTDIGCMRASNEDNLISVVPQDHHLLRAKGALFYQDLQDDIPTALLEAIKQANAAIYQANEVERVLGADDFSIGTTCVAAVLHDKMLYAANVGDSRIYVLHEGQLRQITRDHSLVAQLVERGEITPAEARSHEKRHLIYRWLGLQNVETDLFIEPVQEGDTLILCTDGLCNVVKDEDLRTIVEQHEPEECVQHLIARANEEGGPDNVTAIVVRISVGSILTIDMRR